MIRGIESVVASPSGNNEILNDLDCPLLMLTRTIFTVKSSAILNAVSVVHECGSTCKFVIKQWPGRIEREQYLSSRIEYEHDYGNSLYYLNVYCMNSS